MRLIEVLYICQKNGLKDLDDLNLIYFKWLKGEYKRKSHKGLNGLILHDVYMSQISKVNLVTGRYNRNCGNNRSFNGASLALCSR